MKTFNEFYEEECKRTPGLREAVEEERQILRVQEKLRLAREKSGLTQDQVADRMHVNRSFVSRVETQSGNITLSTLERYARGGSALRNPPARLSD